MKSETNLFLGFWLAFCGFNLHVGLFYLEDLIFSALILLTIIASIAALVSYNRDDDKQKESVDPFPEHIMD